MRSQLDFIVVLISLSPGLKIPVYWPCAREGPTVQWEIDTIQKKIKKLLGKCCVVYFSVQTLLKNALETKKILSE